MVISCSIPRFHFFQRFLQPLSGGTILSQIHDGRCVLSILLAVEGVATFYSSFCGLVKWFFFVTLRNRLSRLFRRITMFRSHFFPGWQVRTTKDRTERDVSFICMSFVIFNRGRVTSTRPTTIGHSRDSYYVVLRLNNSFFQWFNESLRRGFFVTMFLFMIMRVFNFGSFAECKYVSVIVSRCDSFSFANFSTLFRSRTAIVTRDHLSYDNRLFGVHDFKGTSA